MPNWTDLFNSRKRQNFPGVVVPLAKDAPAPEKPTPNAENDSGSASDEKKSTDDRLAKATSQENGSSYGPQSSSTLTLESLRAEVESDVSASGMDTVYDRMLTVVEPSCDD